MKTQRAGCCVHRERPESTVVNRRGGTDEWKDWCVKCSPETNKE